MSRKRFPLPRVRALPRGASVKVAVVSRSDRYWSTRMIVKSARTAGREAAPKSA